MDDLRRKRIEELFRLHGAGVGSFMLTRVGSAELAEELTARVFLKVVQHFEQCRGAPAPWLWSIVRNELRMHYRERIPAASFGAALRALPDPAAEHAHPEETWEELRAAWTALTDGQQQVLYLKFFQDMDNQEIAGATGLTPSHVGVLLFRGLKTLRAQLQHGSAEATAAQKR